MAVQNSIFRDFTRQYALSKTLRFELKPTNQTRVILERDHLLPQNQEESFLIDKARKEKYERSKSYFDRLHREFAQDALDGLSLPGLDAHLELYRTWSSMRSDKQAIDNLKKSEKRLRQRITREFDICAERWAQEKYKDLGLKKKDLDILFEEDVFHILNARFGDDLDAQIVDPETGEAKSIFDDWKGFTGYFKKFHETRKNFYTDDGASTAIATRIIDQNLRRFCGNVLVLERLDGVVDWTEAEATFGIPLVEICSADFYSRCLLQDGIDLYNRIIGGELMENGEKKKGINECINQYRQTHSGEKLPFLKTLDKQILSEHDHFVIGIQSDEECIEALKQFRVVSQKKIKSLDMLIRKFVSDPAEYDLEKIYLSREAINTIARRWTEDADVFEAALFDAFGNAKDKSAKYEKEERIYVFPEFVSLSRIRDALENHNDEQTGRMWRPRYFEDTSMLLESKDKWSQFLLILQYEWSSLFEKQIADDTMNGQQVGFDISSGAIDVWLGGDVQAFDSETKILVKSYADDVLRIYQMGKYFALEKKRAWSEDYEIDPLFYSDPEIGYRNFYENAYQDIVQAYNQFRNYLTRKPWEAEKQWKLSFENPTLANGWDQNKEADNSAVIFRKESRYYLGIMKKGKTHLFKEKHGSDMRPKDGEEYYEKMVYKFLPGPSKMMPKVCFSGKGLEFFKPSAEILEIYNKGKFKKGDTFDLVSMQKLIAFYKECLASYPGWSGYDFSQVREAGRYIGNINEFYADVARAGYRIDFDQVAVAYIEQAVERGDLYLFEIYNQDFAPGKKGQKKNLHTMYFESLFPPHNSDDFIMKLNGEAEIFFRPATGKDRLGTKTDANGKEVIMHKRYADSKIFFHCPITLNRERGEARNFNRKMNEFLAENPKVNVIGIDRGEKHLAYYSVINRQQGVITSGSLNKIGDVDYASKLEEKAKGREQARKDWQAVEGIKDLKKGYISQAVRKIADLAIEHDAIVVLEDLNMRFKQIRGGIEKSVYQQFEKALIEKFGFLAQKDISDIHAAGHPLNAFQLAAPFESFQKMGKQTGSIFYTQASYTSKIDPVTGWRPNLILKYVNAKQAKSDIGKLSMIQFDTDKERFEITYDLKDFQTLVEWPKNTAWTLCTSVERWHWDRRANQKKGEYVHYGDLTGSFMELFQKEGIDISGDIKSQIDRIPAAGHEEFWRGFVFFWRLLCQIRNTDPRKEAGDDAADFLLSPVEPCFDSRTADQFGEGLPENGDANGAYHIARKGVLILEKIDSFKQEHGTCEKMTWGNLFISHTEWDDFAQKHHR